MSCCPCLDVTFSLELLSSIHSTNSCRAAAGTAVAVLLSSRARIQRGAREESRIPDASFVGCLCPRRAWARPIDSAKLLPSRSDNNRSQDANRQRGSLRFARHLRRVKEKDHDRPTQDLLSDGPDGSSGRLLRQSMSARALNEWVLRPCGLATERGGRTGRIQASINADQPASSPLKNSSGGRRTLQDLPRPLLFTQSPRDKRTRLVLHHRQTSSPSNDTNQKPCPSIPDSQ